MKKNKIKIGFFGTPQYAVITLEKLMKSGYQTDFVVTQPDKPRGRKMILAESPVKIYAKNNNIPVYQPENLKDIDFINEIKKYNTDVFIVIGYGKIIPEEILNIPKHKSLNIHGSLLPYLRGPSPIETAILNDIRETGGTIIKMDREMDHGPTIAMKKVEIENWPPKADDLRNKIVEETSDLLIFILPDYIEGKIKEIPQEHSQATFTKMITKEDGLMDLNDDAYKNYLKIQAYHEWPGTFFFKDGKRIKITEARFSDGKLEILKVIPEGRKEISYKDFISKNP
ncbi:MAG TPA: methionyl-tRNA formyltransferase [Candidatus Paceibacterota bacterium]